MAANLETPNFPVITWDSRLTGTLSVENLDTTNTLYIDFTDRDFDTKYGFDCSSGLQASTDSIHGYLASLIQAFLQGDGAPTATVTATYDFTSTPGTVRVVYALANALDDIEFTFDSDASARQFGIRNASAFSVPTGDSATTDFNSCCYWMPYNLTCYDDRRTTGPSIFANQSLNGTTIKTRAWADQRTLRALTFPYVRPGYLWLYRREDTNYATPAQQDVDDPNNLYQEFLTAARRNNDEGDATVFRIVAKTVGGSQNQYRQAAVVDNRFLEDPQRSVRDATRNAAIFFNVSIVFRDLGDNGSGGI
jgi:hypothetical protein